MFSIIGLLRRPTGMDPEAFRTWWLEEHVPRVLDVPGLRDYRLWTASEGLDHRTLEFTAEPPYDGVAIITFDSKEAFEKSFRSTQGGTDAQSFNAGAPDSTVFAGVYHVFRDGGIAESLVPGSAR